MYPKDTEKWKQFTTKDRRLQVITQLFCIPKILKNESNSQRSSANVKTLDSCFVSQRYWKMKAIHNIYPWYANYRPVVLYPKDTEKWKQFTTADEHQYSITTLFCIPKILKNESNSQLYLLQPFAKKRCFVSQRYWKMKAIHNGMGTMQKLTIVVLYPKDTEKWKQFTTRFHSLFLTNPLFCIPKILKNESNSQPIKDWAIFNACCFVSQRYWKMKAIHNPGAYNII